MAVGGITVQILNRGAIDRMSADFDDLAADMFSRGGLRTLLQDIRDKVLIPSFDQNFSVGGRPTWPPLAESTLAQGGERPLVRSGQLRKHATAKARFLIRDNQMTYGDWPEKRWFGPVHDLEALAERAGIPARPFALIQPEDEDRIGNIAGEWLENKVDDHIKRRYV